MTRDELQAKLSAKGVDESLYSLDGLVNRSECYCAVPENGTWKVVYIERGQVSEIATGLTQSEAYDFIYSEFRTVYGWQN
jgi:hypothetical protein